MMEKRKSSDPEFTSEAGSKEDDSQNIVSASVYVLMGIFGTAIVVAFLVGALTGTDATNSRWNQYNNCIDNETTIGAVTINDCDSYYKAPGTRNGEEPTKDK